MSNSQQIFDAWLAGDLSTDACRQALSHDAVWRARFETAAQLQQLARQPEYVPVPSIDTSSMFRQQWGHKTAPSTAWWPRLSVGMSALALIISISPLHVQVQNGGIALRWSEVDPQQMQLQVQQQVAAQLASYKTEQQQYLQLQMQTQQQQQASQLIMLKDYLTEAEQKNRRGDMLELVEYLNQQRQSDWQYWQDNVQPTQARLNYSPDSRINRQN
jgi:hypothetical protein